MAQQFNPALRSLSRWRWRVLVLLIVVAVVFLGIHRFRQYVSQRSPESMLAGQSNLRTTFYGHAVDESGKALAGVHFEFVVEAYPADWTFATRGRDYERTSLSAHSDGNGDFQIDVTGCMLRLRSAEIEGYRELYELEGGTFADGNSVFTRTIHLISWSEQQYKSDPDRPAVFVFAREGAAIATTLPSQGGSRAYGRHRWIENRPAWPRKPSLIDVDWVDAPSRRNVSVPLVFKVINTMAHPMSDVSIAFEVERYRTLEEMRRDHTYGQNRTRKERGLITTGSDGFARTQIEGFRLHSIYRVFLDGTKWGEGPSPIIDMRQKYYLREFVDQRGDQAFRSDDESPILIVMAKPGEEFSYVCPSRGGYERRDGSKQWHRVEPEWPEDVRGGIRLRVSIPTSAPITSPNP